MFYDLDFRHQQALDPSALTTIATTLDAITKALTDCRNAGKAGEADPAVLLLARHLGEVARTSQPDDATLRQRCLQEMADIKRSPALLVLAHRGVAFDDDAKRLFHQQGKRAMRELAGALGLADGSYDITTNKGGPAVSGEITLHGEEVLVQLSINSMGPGHEVVFRRVRGRRDHIGDANRWTSVRDLLAPQQFADRLIRELRLSGQPAARATLFA